MQTVRVAQKLLPQEAASAVVQQAIGGANPHRQAEALKMNRPLLVVGTPGEACRAVEVGRLTDARHQLFGSRRGGPAACAAVPGGADAPDGADG